MSRHVIDDAIAEIRRLREINEELLKALKGVRDLSVDCSQEADRAMWAIAHAAIHRAEESQS